MLTETGLVPDIQGMISGEKEEVEFNKPIKIRASGVEIWMK